MKFFTQIYFNYPCNAYLEYKKHIETEVLSHRKCCESPLKKKNLLMQFEDVAVVSCNKYYAIYIHRGEYKFIGLVTGRGASEKCPENVSFGI
jgi:hypothetical protein